MPWLGWGVAAAAAAVLLSVGWRSLRPTESPRERRAASRAAMRRRRRSCRSPTSTARGPRSKRRTALGRRPAAIASPPERPCACRAPAISCSRSIRARGCASAPRRASRLTALGATQRFDVESGTLEADVAKVPLGGRFIVATGDAEVEVKGTRFEVAVVPTASACAPFARTQVMVQEGVVVVRFAGGEVRLPAGSVWPACPPPAPAVHGSRSRRAATPCISPGTGQRAVGRAASRSVDAGGAERSLRRGARRAAARRSRRSHPLARSVDRPLPDGPADRQRARRAAAADRGERRESAVGVKPASIALAAAAVVAVACNGSIRFDEGRGRRGWSGRCGRFSRAELPEWRPAAGRATIAMPASVPVLSFVDDLRGHLRQLVLRRVRIRQPLRAHHRSNANIECSEGADCTFVLGDRSRADCAAGSTCNVRCVESCLLVCDAAATCELQCPNGISMIVSGSATCS